MSHEARLKISRLIAVMFIFLFVYTAVSKLLDFHLFVITIRRSPLIGNNAFIVAWVLPAAELIVAVLLIIAKTRRVGLYASLTLMVIFTSYILFMLLFLPQLPCSCGGVLQSMGWKEHLVFNLVFIGLAWLGLAFEKEPTTRKIIFCSIS